MKNKLYAGDFIAFIHFKTRSEAREWTRKHPQGWKPRMYTCKIVYGKIEKEKETEGFKPLNPWFIHVYKLTTESKNFCMAKN